MTRAWPAAIPIKITKVDIKEGHQGDKKLEDKLTHQELANMKADEFAKKEKSKNP